MEFLTLSAALGPDALRTAAGGISGTLEHTHLETDQHHLETPASETGVVVGQSGFGKPFRPFPWSLNERLNDHSRLGSQSAPADTRKEEQSWGGCQVSPSVFDFLVWSWVGVGRAKGSGREDFSTAGATSRTRKHCRILKMSFRRLTSKKMSLDR